MKIALINENSQAAKNAQIEASLRKVVEPMGHTVYNYGMYSASDEVSLTYVQAGILAAILLNSGAADYVITGNVEDVVYIHEYAVKVVLGSFILAQDLLEFLTVESLFAIGHLLVLFSPSVLQTHSLVEHKIVGSGVGVCHEVADALEL